MAANGSADLIVKVAANISALQSDFAAAAASVKNIESAVVTANTASTSWAGSLNDLGHSWVLRIAEGQLLRDAVREVIATMKEMAAFLPELAMKGAVVGDVEEGFRHLATQAGQTSEVLLTTLRAGTHGTIDDFQLMQRANKDLAAGLNLTDAQFGTLAQGAFALAKATGGSTADALDKMSDALVTGRAKGVAMLTGKIDLKVAEEAYAVSLGGTTANLTAEQKLDADRIAILAGVQAGLARVGEQHDSLKDKVAQTAVVWENFKDELGKQIAQSPVLAAGFDSLRASLTAAFGGDQKTLIENIAAAVNTMAIYVVDFGIGAAATAGALVQVWYGIKTAILAVETVFVGFIDLYTEELAAAAQIAGKLHLISPETVAEVIDARTQTRAMTVSLAEQTVEAAKGAAGQSALSQAIDKGTGMLYTMRDAMVAASGAHAAAVEPIEHVGEATTHVGTALKLTAAEMKALADLVSKTATENVILWDQWAANAVKASGTATDTQLADLKRLSDKMTAERILAGTADADYYALRASLDKQANDAILTDHARVAKGSIEALQQEADKQRATLADMESGSLHYSRDVMDEQIAKVHAAEDAARGYGATAIAAHDAAAAAAQKNADAILKVKEAADAAKAAMMAMGNSLDIGHAARDPEIMAFLHQGWSLENAEALKFAGQWGFQAKTYSPKGAPETAPDPSERVPGYLQGGPTLEGPAYLHADEYVVPKGGALVLQNSAGGAASVTNIYITQPFGTPTSIAKAVDDAFMKRKRDSGERF